MIKDIFERIKETPGPLGQYQGIGDGYFMFPRLVGEIGPEMEFNGKPVLNWSLNNYLGLANHPEVRKADAEAAATWSGQPSRGKKGRCRGCCQVWSWCSYGCPHDVR